MEIPKFKLVFSRKQKEWPCTIDQMMHQEVVDSPQCAYRFDYKQTFRGQEYDAVRLAFLYKSNPGYWWGTFGKHPKDVEGVVFLFKNNRLEYVVFSIHGKKWAMIRTPETCHYDDEGFMLGYVAPKSNATYPEPKTYWRIYGLANDKTCFLNSGGVVWPVSPILHTNDLPKPVLVNQTLTKHERFFYPSIYKIPFLICSVVIGLSVLIIGLRKLGKNKK